MCGLPRILSHFCNKFNKFNNAGARMLASIYHMTLKLLEIIILARKRYDFAILLDVTTNMVIPILMHLCSFVSTEAFQAA